MTNGLINVKENYKTVSHYACMIFKPDSVVTKVHVTACVIWNSECNIVAQLLTTSYLLAICAKYDDSVFFDFSDAFRPHPPDNKKKLET